MLLSAGAAHAQQQAADEAATPPGTGTTGTTATGTGTTATGTGTTGSTYEAPHVAPYRSAPASEVRDDDFTHKQQVSLRLGLGGDAFFAIKTAHGPRCDTSADGTFCRGLGNALLDGEIAFAPTDGLEITSLIQVGFSNDPLARTLPVILGLGIRLYPSPHDRVKPFFGFRGALKYLDMTTSSSGEHISSWDGGFRVEGGLQVEITRAVGVYAQVAVSLFFVNDFTIPFDFTGGAQVRFP